MAPQPTGPAQPQSLAPGAFTSANPVPTGGAADLGYTGVSKGYIPPPQPGVKREQTGSGVYDTQGNLLPFYNLNTRPGEILASLDEKTLKKLTQTLYSRGWYGDRKPGGGLSDNDKEAMQNLLYVSNLQGRTWEQTFSSVAKAPVSTGTGSGRAQVASTEDLVSLANKTALSTMGRKLTEDEAARFAKAYQGVQAGSAGASQAAPSADVFFQNRIEQQYGTESDAHKYLGAISNVAKLMESL